MIDKQTLKDWQAGKIELNCMECGKQIKEHFKSLAEMAPLCVRCFYKLVENISLVGEGEEK